MREAYHRAVLRFELGRGYGWPLPRALAFALWKGKRHLKDGRPLSLLEEFEMAFPGKCPVCSFHRYGVSHGHIPPGRPVKAHVCAET